MNWYYLLILGIILYYVINNFYENYSSEHFDPSLVPVSSIVTISKVLNGIVGKGNLTVASNLSIGNNLNTDGSATVNGNISILNSSNLNSSFLSTGPNAAIVLFDQSNDESLLEKLSNYYQFVESGVNTPLNSYNGIRFNSWDYNNTTYFYDTDNNTIRVLAPQQGMSPYNIRLESPDKDTLYISRNYPRLDGNQGLSVGLDPYSPNCIKYNIYDRRKGWYYNYDKRDSNNQRIGGTLAGLDNASAEANGCIITPSDSSLIPVYEQENKKLRFVPNYGINKTVSTTPMIKINNTGIISPNSYMLYATTGDTPILTPGATTFPTLDRDDPFPAASQPPVFPNPDQQSTTTTKFQRISSLDPSNKDDTLTLNADVRIDHHASIYGTLNAGTVKLNFPQNFVQINCKNLTSYDGLNIKSNTTDKVVGWVQVGSNVVLKNKTDDITYLTIDGNRGDLNINGTFHQKDILLKDMFQRLVTDINTHIGNGTPYGRPWEDKYIIKS
jgi:hypothetical protein